MRILNDWQYRYIEKSLFGYYDLQRSELDTEKRMFAAIEEALCYFSGSAHEIMMREFYFKRTEHCKHYTSSGHYRHVCIDLLHTEESNGYVIKREIIYRVAMICYELGVFKSGAHRFLN